MRLQLAGLAGNLQASKHALDLHNVVAAQVTLITGGHGQDDELKWDENGRKSK